ncbi:hypothetical protein HOLleu_00967 [Holothuria leucospilota]|uniref:Uncharacterized protein n=1 Tax=Holothuria leucospilota TaxID=206669 RepID=A0A9Q1CNP8_HOLLE|nr:hypothetical protein HOLleu_00967 [Holothuria leucospilota]
MENLMCTEGAPRAQSTSSYAWCPGARDRAPCGVQGAKPPEVLAVFYFKSTEIGSSSYVSEILYLFILHGN